MNDPILEQANAALEEARQVLAKSNENLNKSISFTDQALINQRRLILAMSSLLPKPILSVVNTDLAEEEQVESFADDMAISLNTREAFDIVHSINVLAMANTDILNINTQFRGNSNLFIVRVRPLSVVSPEGDDYQLQSVVYRGEVSLIDGFYVGCPTGDCHVERLLTIESELTELIIEAREEAEAKAEVGA
ncbi:hypothetical protein [Vibrio sp. EA2]|uniref:hypothetical protein n=1 Tax=Vibrio sp. EA2 TaxID=3079860 RepID=UPI00294969C4|nr:hypothetical protein [Vibrio sp. EA2]MDV6252094.1 hypothetical protein [Vibrio sp. EA2]